MNIGPAPLNVDPDYAPNVRATLAEIMAPGPALADEYALIDLRSQVADALHLGKIDIPEHDALITEIRAAHGTII